MNDDLKNEIAELKRRLLELEAKQAEKEKPEFIPDPQLSETLANYNPLDGMRMDPGSAKRLALNVKAGTDVMGAWARERIPNGGGGFGPPPGGDWGKGSTRDDELPIPQPVRSLWSK